MAGKSHRRCSFAFKYKSGQNYGSKPENMVVPIMNSLKRSSGVDKAGHQSSIAAEMLQWTVFFQACIRHVEINVPLNPSQYFPFFCF